MSSAVISPSEPGTDPRLQRSLGSALVAFRHSAGRSRLSDLRQSSPCRALFPRPADPAVPEAVFINTAGGVAAGDRLHYGIEVGAGALVQVTTQAAEKVYRSTGQTARLHTQITVGGHASLEWLPQETILFDGSRLERSVDVAIEGSGSALLFDSLVFGRTHSGEALTHGRLLDRWTVRRDGRLVWADCLRLDGDITRLLARPALLDGAGATGCLLYLAPSAGALLETARSALSGCGLRCGATLPRPGLLLCRFLAASGAALRGGVLRFLAGFRPGLAGLSPGLPRLWSC